MTDKFYQGQGLTSRGVFCEKLTIPALFHNLLWAPSKLFVWFFLRLEVETEADLEKLSGPLIVASNHTCWADSFMIISVFRFNAKVFPIHYAVLKKLYYFPLSFPFLWLSGAFPVRRKVGLEESLKVPIKIIHKGGVVGIFPEGKREWKEGLSRPKRGVAYLAFKTGTKILPVRIIIPVKNMTFSGVLLRRYKTKIKIGKPFYLPSKEIKVIEDYNQPANYVMNRIHQL